MFGPNERGGWTLAALMAVAVLVVSGCELKPATNQIGSASPSSEASPSPSPSPEPTPITIAAPPFHSGEVTVAYAPVALVATGGTPPFQWSIGGGAFPGGLTLSAGGSVSGTPSTAGSFSFTIHVADTGSRTADVAGTISIAAAPMANLTSACAQHCSVEVGCDITCGSFGYLTGGTAPFTFAVTGGYVPQGVSLTGLALTGTFTTPAQFWQFTVLVTDSLGATSTIAPTFYVFPHISLSGGKCSYVTLPCTVTLPYSGGTPSGSPSMSVVSWVGGSCYGPAPGPCPQPPITAAASGGSLSVTIGPVGPNDYRFPTGTFTLSLTDQDLCGAGVHCSSNGASLALIWTG